MFEHEVHANWMIEQLNQKGYEAYYVGGCVRDVLMGKNYKDIDLTTNASVDTILDLFKTQRIIEKGRAFGSLTVLFDKQGIEITTYRKDEATLDFRHPAGIAVVKTLKEDLLRRDFTVNAIAYHPIEGLKDFVGGINDLQAKRIRCVGDPLLRFQEDALRILRALKFSLRYSFTISKETKEAIHQSIHLIHYLSKERITHELSEILCSDQIEEALMEYSDLFSEVIPALRPALNYPQGNPYHCYDLYTHTAKVVQAVRPDLELRYAALFHDLGKYQVKTVDDQGVSHFYDHETRSHDLFKRFSFEMGLNKTLTKHVLTMILVHDKTIEANQSSCWDWLYQYGEGLLLKILDLKRADNSAKSVKANDRYEKIVKCYEIVNRMLQEKTIYQIKQLDLDGNDLINVGIQGQEIGIMLTELLKEVALLGLENKKEVLIQRVLELRG